MHAYFLLNQNKCIHNHFPFFQRKPYSVHEGGKEWIADIGDDHDDHACLLGFQPPRIGIRVVIQFGDRLFNPALILWCHCNLVDHLGDRAERNSCQLCDILHGRVLFAFHRDTSLSKSVQTNSNQFQPIYLILLFFADEMRESRIPSTNNLALCCK